jgi:hypothetical protein
VRVAYDPSEDKSLPADMSISTNRSPQWTEARDAFIFGIAKLTKTPAPAGGRGAATGTGAPAAAGADAGRGGAGAAADETTAPRPNLVIWHYKDPRLQTQQQVQEASDRALNYVTMYRTDDKKLVRLADEEVPSVAVNARTRWAIATVTAPYELDANLDGRRFMDIYAVDTKTGQRKVVRKHLRWGNGTSPDGAKYLFYENQHFYVFDAETGTERNITLGMQTSFVDTEDDHPVVDPRRARWDGRPTTRTCCLRQLGHLEGARSAGQQPVNLTVNGKKDKIRYQNRVRTDLQERGADMSKRQVSRSSAK